MKSGLILADDEPGEPRSISLWLEVAFPLPALIFSAFLLVTLQFCPRRQKLPEFGQPEARLIFGELFGNLEIKQASETSAIASTAQGRDNTALFYPAWAGFSSPGAASNEAVFP